MKRNFVLVLMFLLVVLFVLLWLRRNEKQDYQNNTAYLPTPTTKLLQPSFLGEAKEENGEDGLKIVLPEVVNIYNFKHKALTSEIVDKTINKLGINKDKDKTESGIKGGLSFFNTTTLDSLLIVPDSGKIEYSRWLNKEKETKMGVDQKVEDLIIKKAEEFEVWNEWSELPIRFWRKQYELNTGENLEIIEAGRANYVRVWLTPYVEDYPILGEEGGLIMFLFNNEGKIMQVKINSLPNSVTKMESRKVTSSGGVFWSKGWGVLSEQGVVAEEPDGIRYYLSWMEVNKQNTLLPIVVGERYFKNGRQGIFRIVSKSLVM